MPEIAAGRELDAAVAEKLFGRVWLRHTIRVQTPDKKRWGVEWRRSLLMRKVESFFGDHGAEYIPAIGNEEIGVMNAPHYSTSIADAWAVVEKMMPEWIADMEMDRHGCTFSFGQGYATTPRVSRASGDTAPLAICRAALKAVGYTEESA